MGFIVFFPFLARYNANDSNGNSMMRIGIFVKLMTLEHTLHTIAVNKRDLLLNVVPFGYALIELSTNSTYLGFLSGLCAE